MKKLLLGFTFLLTYFELFAQNQKANFPFLNNMQGDKKVIADTAILKVAPSTGAASTDTLFLGNNVNILMQVPFSEVRNNVSSPWLKITYKKGAFTKVAFISAIDLAISNTQSIQNNQVIIGIEKNNRLEKFENEILKVSNNYVAKIILLKDNQKLQLDTFLLPNSMMVDSFANFSFTKIDLKKTSGLLKINFANSSIKNVGYEYNYVVCKNSLVGLHFINPNPVDIAGINIAQNKLVFKSKKIIHLLSGDLIGTKEIATYKWKNCNYIKE